jgi:carboxyl-terminal processing protease
MKLSPSRALLFWVVLLTAAVLFGGLYGTQAQATTGAEEDLDASLKTFTALLSMVERNHATAVDPAKAVYGAIDGMLRTLDPHSKFFSPEDFRRLREDQRGKYYGLGITVTSRFGKVTVVSPPFPGAPAEKVGLRVGDVLSHVNGEPTEGVDLNTVVGQLKGPKGTPVNVTVTRPGVDEPFEVTIIRDEISKFTISNAFEIREGIGYIKIDNFAETTGAELREALRELDGDNLKGLVLDLRGNPGGLLQEAIEVSSMFLQKGQLIVETRGRTRGSNRPYASQRVNNDNLYPLVVVINKQSASASEIVAGAVQDHDRGLIVGETSFGKGLVQSVYPLSKRAGLALTTQKWHTPSGRLIQRDYSAISQFDYYNQREGDPEPDETEITYSDLGRKVYGGGGITPDENVPTPGLNEFEDLLTKRFAVYTFVRDFLADNPTVTSEFEVSDEMLREFGGHLVEREIEMSESALADNADFVKRMIKYEVFYNRLGVSDAAKVLLNGDRQILRALELLPEAGELSMRARSAMARRQ